MKKLLRIIPIIIIVGIGIYFLKPKPKVPDIHFHAGFQVYVDGQLQDFSASKFMSVSNCKVNESKSNRTPEEEQLEKAHLHDGVGNVVHAHANGGVWSDLFKNLNYSLDTSKGVVGYVNGAEVKDILNYPIMPYDSVIIGVGSKINLNNTLNAAVTKDQILIVEQKSESCGTEN